MDALSYQGLFIFQIKSFSCFQPRTPTGLCIWDTLRTHGRGSFKALVSSPGTLSRTIYIDLLKIWTIAVHMCPFDEKDCVPQCAPACQFQGCVSHRYQTGPSCDSKLIGFPDVPPCISLNPTPLQGHCPAINHSLHAAWGEWGDVAWCISHMLDSWAHCE